MRTQEEINRQIEGLKKMKTWLPQYSRFGDNNWANIDAQLDILEYKQDLDDMDDGDWENMDETNSIYLAAQDADGWMNGDTNDDLFEEQS